MDYLSQKVEEAPFSDSTVIRRVFREHLTAVAKALHAIEWVDSGDWTEGDEEAYILSCLSGVPLCRVPGHCETEWCDTHERALTSCRKGDVNG